ncbi:hypothetical protein GWI54_25050 [Salmonella enterica]|nr:hypothetical protein [Salmonella enterica]
MSHTVFVFYVKNKTDHGIVEFVVNESLSQVIKNIEDDGIVLKQDGFFDFDVIDRVRRTVLLGIDHFMVNASGDYNPIEISVLENTIYTYVLMNVGNYFGRSKYD